jgi:hypothetical protein
VNGERVLAPEFYHLLGMCGFRLGVLEGWRGLRIQRAIGVGERSLDNYRM